MLTTIIPNKRKNHQKSVSKSGRQITCVQKIEQKIKNFAKKNTCSGVQWSGAWGGGGNWPSGVACNNKMHLPRHCCFAECEKFQTATSILASINVSESMLGKTCLVDQTGFWDEGSTSVVKDRLLLKIVQNLIWHTSCESSYKCVCRPHTLTREILFKGKDQIA